MAVAEDRREAEIVLIDDSDADAMLISIVARQSKLSNDIRHFLGGREALDYLLDSSVRLPDLILLDLNMPGMNGHEVLAEIRSTPRLQRLPVVILTSSESDSDLARSYDEHANAYVVKPVAMDGFRTIVDAISDFWMAIVVRPPGYADVK